MRRDPRCDVGHVAATRTKYSSSVLELPKQNTDLWRFVLTFISICQSPNADQSNTWSPHAFSLKILNTFHIPLMSSPSGAFDLHATRSAL